MMTHIAESAVRIPADEVTLEGNLSLPENSGGVVVFAHGSGSSRYSPRNRFVAQVLQKAGLGTLLFDLLTAGEEAEDEVTGKLRFNIPFLAERLVNATDWLMKSELIEDLHLGYFGASTGAAAALIAAASRPDIVSAVVSRGGRPDLALPVLNRVKAPTLLIVGGADYQVIDLNRKALAALKAESKLVIIPGATHLFEEPGTLEQAASYARDWFVKYLAV
ncbi:MAG: dienelactone hydrolase family protein [Dehalococcoidales bacterium]|nr:dienelactone hydrolase family protein [Dehalococcoidales bacterium]